MMNWIKALTIMGFLVFLILLLWVENTKKENRYKQLFNLPVFILIAGISMYFYNFLNEHLFVYFYEWTHLNDLQNLHIGILVSIVFATLVFLFVKPALPLLRKYVDILWAYKKEVKDGKVEEYYVRNDFDFTRKVIKISLAVIILLSLIFFYYLTVRDVHIFYYLYFVLLFAFELYWYTNGKEKPLPEVINIDDKIDEVIVKNDTNFEKVLSYFRNHKEVLKDEKLIKVAKIRRIEKEKEVTKKETSKMKGDLILHTANYTLLKDNLKKKITEVVLNGGNVLIIAPFWNIILKNNDEELDNPYFRDLREYFNDLLQGHHKLSDIFDIQVYSSAHGNERLKKNIVMTSAFDILYFNRFIMDNEKWFKKLDLVIFENVLEQIVFSRSAQSSLSIILKSINKKVVFWFLSYPSIGFESAIRSQFLRQGDIEEVAFVAYPEPLSYILSFKNENRALQNTLYNLADRDYMGNEALVLYEANRLGQTNNQWIYSYEQPDADYVEELKQTTVLEPKYLENVDNDEQSLIQLIKEDESPFFVINDDKHNFANLLYRLRLKDNRKAFYAVSNYPYLFRDYMHDNIPYFTAHPLQHIAPQIDQNDDENSLIALFESLKKYKLSKKQILAVFNENNIDDIIAYMHEKFKKTFNFTQIERYVQVSTKKDVYTQWTPIKTYSIKTDSDITLNTSFNFFDIRDGSQANSNSFGRIQKGLAYQFFFKKPMHIYHNKSFKLKKIDLKNDIILLEHEQEKVKDKWVASRGIFDISIDKINSLPPIEYRNKLGIRLGLVEADFSIERIGRYDFVGDIDYDYKKAIKYNKDYYVQFFDKENDVKKELISNYKNKKSFYFSIDISNLLNKKIKLDEAETETILGKISYSLSYLIYEALQTFFSDSFEYIHVVPLNKLPEEYDEMKILPNVISNMFNEVDTTKEISLLIIENSPLDIGILEALKDRLYSVVLGHVDDYLRWHISKFETNKDEKRIFGQINVDEGHIVKGGVNKNAEYESMQSFIKCVNGEYPDFFDFINTKLLLSELFEINELTRSRLSYKGVEDIESVLEGEDDDLPHYCDFCGREYPLSEMDVIQEDGRERCPICSENAMDEEQDILEIHGKEIKAFFDYFKLDMPKFEEISINYKNAKEINQNYNVEFIPTRFFDPRVLGFATIRDDKYYIEAENMAPKKRTILTTIHEMVHLWQFKHLNFKKMKEDYDLLLIEGMTTWSEIYYAKKIAKWEEDWENIIAPESRDDEYGSGYRLIKKILEDEGVEHPFDLMLRHYPKQ